MNKPELQKLEYYDWSDVSKYLIYNGMTEVELEKIWDNWCDYHNLTNGGYIRLYKGNTTLKNIVERIQKILQSDDLIFYVSW